MEEIEGKRYAEVAMELAGRPGSRVQEDPAPAAAPGAKEGLCGAVVAMRGVCSRRAGHDGDHAWLASALPAAEVNAENVASEDGAVACPKCGKKTRPLPEDGIVHVYCECGHDFLAARSLAPIVAKSEGKSPESEGNSAPDDRPLDEKWVERGGGHQYFSPPEQVLENVEHCRNLHPARKTIITHEQARASLQRFINRHFNNRGEKSRASIPAHQDDDDILLSDYITQVEMNYREAKALAEVQRLTALINSPEILDFIKAVQIEAAHQRERWDPDHDAQKQDEDWFWTLGYLSGKALRAQRDGDCKKHLHHLISSAALLCNWHAVSLREARRENGSQNQTAIK